MKKKVISLFALIGIIIYSTISGELENILVESKKELNNANNSAELVEIQYLEIGRAACREGV